MIFRFQKKNYDLKNVYALRTGFKYYLLPNGKNKEEGRLNVL